MNGSRKRQPLGLQSLCMSLLEHSYASNSEKSCHTEVLCRLYLQLHHRKNNGLVGPPSENEVEHTEEGTGVEAN